MNVAKEWARKLMIMIVVLAMTSFIPHEPKNRVKHYGIKDGLSQGVINSIVQDDQSLLWFATEDGLNRFDGYTFKIFKYDPENASSLADNFVQNVFRDAQGTLWVSSRKGLLQFDPLKETFLLFTHGTPEKSDINETDVSYITEGAANNLWVAWYGNGFASFNKEKKLFTPYTPQTLPGLGTGKTITLLEDKFGLLWVGTQDNGLNVFKVSNGAVVKSHENLTDKKILPSLNVRCFAEDKFGNIWIGTANGLVLYSRQENKFFTFNDPRFAVANRSIMSLLADGHENLWIGSQGGGLFQLDLRQFHNRALNDFIFTRTTSLNEYDISKRTILSLYEDKEKNIWLGTFGSGAYMISSVKEKFVKIQTRQYVNNAVSFAIYYGMCYDNDGHLWLGTDGDGIYRSTPSGETIRHYTADGKKGSILDNAVLSALHDRKNNLWFGTYARGVFRYNKASDTFINYRYASDDRSRAGGNDVRLLFEDSKENIWAGTNRGGLCLVDAETKTYKNLPFFKGILKEGDIRSIAEDRSGGFWIGCYGDGLYYFNPFTRECRRHFDEADTRGQLKSSVVFALETDRKGRVWIGTGGSGLCVYDPVKKKLQRYSDNDGLSNNTIYAILIDHADNIWISTNTGISKFDAASEKFYNYNPSDGLQEGQFNPGSAVYNDLAGYMCFGGTAGLNILYPDQVEEPLKKPEVMISGFQLFNKPVQVDSKIDGNPILTKVINRTQHITLKHDQSVFTFEFVGLNYSYPEKNEYAYKLERLDQDWNFVGHQRTATYRYLKPGNYTFKVKASNRENVWDDAYASIDITILPPFWQTPLAYFLYVLGAGAIGFSIVSVRKKQANLRKRLKIEKTQRKRERLMVQEKLSFFTEVSHEFRTPLTLMIGPLEEMLTREGNVTPTGRKLKMVYRNANKLLNLINKLLDYRKIESGNILLKVQEDDIVLFVEELYITFRELAIRKNINFHFQPEQPSIPVWFDKEKLEMVLNNVISNSFKYIGKGNEIVISVQRQVSDKYPHGKVAIKIKDNGIGIPKKQVRHIFDWFHKGDNSGPMSSGIGLALAKKLVHLHKGEIFVDSVEGAGSTFSIKIPLGRDHFKPHEIIIDDNREKFLTDEVSVNGQLLEPLTGEDDDAAGKKGFRSLLLVEDDDEIRTFLREYFEKAYRVSESKNGREGLDFAMAHHPDLIISDIMMPEMNGVDLCKELKSNIRTSHIPIILLTAKTSLTHHKEGIEIGADAYITKPFSPEMLALTITNLLQSRENLMRFYRNLFSNTSNGSTAQDMASPDEKFLHSIYDILKAHLDKTDFNVNELSDALNMSRSLVYKKIKMLTGLSPVEYIRTLRMQEAAKLLKSRKYKVFEVAYMVGFSDAKYFRQCFTKEFGYSPSDFIKATPGP
jgi:ligand-binding sensor domain-containing protein/signal transduction histidine kinase/DNA-binding response OmpR family regulator